MAINGSMLCTQPEFCCAIGGAHINQASIEDDTKRMLRVLATKVGMDKLAFLGGEERVGSDEVGFGLGAENVGENPSTKLVPVDFGEEPF